MTLKGIVNLASLPAHLVMLDRIRQRAFDGFELDWMPANSAYWITEDTLANLTGNDTEGSVGTTTEFTCLYCP